MGKIYGEKSDFIRSIARPLSRPLARPLAQSLAWSLSRSLAPSRSLSDSCLIVRAFTHSIHRSLGRQHGEAFKLNAITDATTGFDAACSLIDAVTRVGA